MASLELPDSLVSVYWLQQHLGHEDLVIFDCSWHMPATGRDGYREWQQQHIPGARFFDFDGKISDPDAELPHMMPNEEIFTRELRALGLGRDSLVVHGTDGLTTWIDFVLGQDQVSFIGEHALSVSAASSGGAGGELDSTLITFGESQVLLAGVAFSDYSDFIA